MRGQGNRHHPRSGMYSEQRQRGDSAPVADLSGPAPSRELLGIGCAHTPPDKCTKAEKAATPRLLAAPYSMERSGGLETQARSRLPSSAPGGPASSYFQRQALLRTKTSRWATTSTP